MNVQALRPFASTFTALLPEIGEPAPVPGMHLICTLLSLLTSVDGLPKSAWAVLADLMQRTRLQSAAARIQRHSSVAGHHAKLLGYLLALLTHWLR
ncbi:hypothetical protein XE97_24385 [Salmonella enterica subsp. enterica serovar Senftenberg]|nr:hypothetical protein [Salmonella enterica subsp. enterica serovar Saintpaul]EBM0725509.1 hypothetical protein [Salmonella enterica subsp. enterica serovar Senftenberg]